MRIIVSIRKDAVDHWNGAGAARTSAAPDTDDSIVRTAPLFSFDHLWK